MADNHISSVMNPRVKRIVRLRAHRKRADGGWTIVEGKREIARAIEAGIEFKEFYVCRDLTGGDFSEGYYTSLKAPVYETTKPVFKKIAYGSRMEGILGLCAPNPMSFSDFPDKADPVILIVESVEKPGNLGAMLRTCDGAGIDGVIICDARTDIYNPNVIRASLGTVFSLPVVVSPGTEALAFCRKRGLKICAATPTGATVYSNIKFNNGIALVVGSEDNGLSELWTASADIRVKIPMRGRADSLNVSASAAILLYEIIRQRST